MCSFYVILHSYDHSLIQYLTIFIILCYSGVYSFQISSLADYTLSIILYDYIARIILTTSLLLNLVNEIHHLAQ